MRCGGCSPKRRFTPKSMAPARRSSVYGPSSKRWLPAALSNSVPEPTTHSGIVARLSGAWGAWGLSGGIYTPFFGAWLAWKHESPEQIGLLLSCGMLLRVVVPPVTGIIADARNDRRGVMIALIVLTFLGYLGLNWAAAPRDIFIFAVLANVAGGAASPLFDGISTRLAERYGFDYGHVKRWNSITFAIVN